MPDLYNISAVEQFTMTGNDPLSNTIASIAEVQIKSILRANLTGFSMRASMTAKSIARIEGLGVAFYRNPQRTVPGTDYDFEKGIIAQKTGALIFQVNIDQHITWNFPFEGFDISRFKTANPETRARMVNEWVSSNIEAYIQGNEAIFMRGVIDYTIAQYDQRPENVLIIDIAKIIDKASALQVYSNLKDKAIILNKLYTPTAMGLDQTQLRIGISLELYQKFVRYIPEIFITEPALKMLVTGRLYSDKAFGIPMIEHLFLNTKFPKGPESGLNKDLDFDFTGVHVMFMIDDAVAQPMGMEQIEWIKNPFTMNMEFKGKTLGSLPVIYRWQYVAISKPAAPTDAEVAAAKAKVYDPNKNSYEQSFKLAEFDSFQPSPAQASAQTASMDAMVQDLKQTHTQELFDLNAQHEEQLAAEQAEKQRLANDAALAKQEAENAKKLANELKAQLDLQAQADKTVSDQLAKDASVNPIDKPKK